MLSSFVCESIIIYDFFSDLRGEPISIQIEPKTASDWPWPAVTFCPAQAHDELNLLSLALDQLEFWCPPDKENT